MSNETKLDQPVQNPNAIPGFWAGCAFWITFTVVALILRGVRWDENFEFAQAMTGLIPLDDAHPLKQYTLAAYNLQFYSSAAILLINDDPIFLCSIRNLLFIVATVLPPFMLGTWTTRNAWIGHAVATFMLIGVHLEFDGVYPQFIWPGMFSNGHVGVGYVLIFAGCLASGHLRWAGLLLGLMPAIHLGQMPPALALAGVYTLRCIYLKEWTPLLGAIRFSVIGAVFCLAFYFVQQHFALPPVTEGAYFSDAPSRPIWEGRIADHDMHRRVPTGNIHIITIATLMLGLGGWLKLRKSQSPLESSWGWLNVYAICVIVPVYTIMGVQLFLGTDIPYLLIGWLPYRLLNHLPVLLLVFVLGILLTIDEEDKGERFSFPSVFVCALFLFYTFKPILPHIVGDSTYLRYFHQNDVILFALIGASYGVLLRNTGASTRLVSLLVPCLFLGLFHRFGAAVVVGSAACLAFGPQSLGVRVSPTHRQKIMYAFLCIPLALIVIEQFQNRTHLPVGSFETEVRDLLGSLDEENALLLSHPEQVLLQAQTGHPVFADMATGYHGSYRPSLAPSLQAMYESVYGIWFEQREMPAASWQTTWSERSPEQWTNIRDTWDIQYVIAPNAVEIQLTPLLEGKLDTLYALPQ